MLTYEHQRTQNLVKRMVALGNFVRLVTVVSFAVLFAGLLATAGVLILGDSWWLAALAGLILGLWLGIYISALIIAWIEWMAQLLVAQGEILAELKKRS
jgi:hypothetical protein